MQKVKPSTAVVEWFTASDAARLSDLSSAMINYLCRHGIIAPSSRASRGHGKVRQYQYVDILLLRVIEKLLAQGISVLRLKRCLRALQKQGQLTDILTKKYVVTNGIDIYFGSGAILEQLGSGQMAFAFIIELSSVRREVEKQIAKKKVA